MEEKREINVFLRAAMFSIDFAQQQGTGDVRESENVQSIPKTTSGLPSWGKAPQSWGVRSRPLRFITPPLPHLYVPGFGFSHMFSLLNETQMRRGFQSFCSLWLPSYVNLGVAVLIYTLLPNH